MMRCDRIFLALLILAGVCHGAEMVSVPGLGLRVAGGFRVSQYAGPDLVPDVTAMAVNPRGSVVVSGPGYIRTLLAPDRDGRATSFREFAATKTGVRGLCFDGESLYFIGDSGLMYFLDADANGVADGPARTVVLFKPRVKRGDASHEMAMSGSVRKGPDGAIYFSAGKDVSVPAQSQATPFLQAGGIFRVTPGGPEPIGHGFRNPNDFDFNGTGDLFASDNEGEGDFFLPWYSPSRILHVAYGGQHGWRMDGDRIGNHPEHYPDTVNAMARLGPAVITGVVCYRHTQFPAHYRDGLFICDWAGGRIYFLPLDPAGASYQGEPELFLESTGSNGFAPSDLAVTPDGALLVSTGGRGTRGGVYVVEFGVGGLNSGVATGADELESVLMAPQAMEAWSRAWWVPMAREMGPEPFAATAMQNSVAIPYRVRAIEILTELHGGLSPETARVCAQAGSAAVRARAAWSLGRNPPANFATLIVNLSRDPDPMVRRWALESILQQKSLPEQPALQQAIGANLAHADERIRQLAARLAALLPDPAWQGLWAQRLDPQSRLTAILALLWRSKPGEVNQTAIDSALGVLGQTRNPDQRLQALGLIIMGLGDYCLQIPSLEVYSGYETAVSLNGYEELTARVRSQVRGMFPSGSQLVDRESARVLAMLEDNDARTSEKVLSMITDSSLPAADFHYLTVFSRLTGRTPTNAAPVIAKAILGLDRKLAGREQRPVLNWEQRLVEVGDRLLRRVPGVADALVADKKFVASAHVHLVSLLDERNSLVAARLFEAAVRQNPNADWPEEILAVLETLPEAQSSAAYRQLWGKTGWRERLILKLAAAPNALDYDKFLSLLSSTRAEVQQACLSALMRLPRDASKRSYLAGGRLLLRLCSEPNETETRAQALAFLNRATAQSFKVRETGSERSELSKAYQTVFGWIAVQDSESWRAVENAEAEDPAGLSAVLAKVPWERGDAARGSEVFREQGCAACHAMGNPLGPDLGGVAQRYTKTNLFYAIAYPSRQIAAGYRPTTFVLRGGQSYTGFIAYEGPEVVLLNTGAQSTVRILASEIASREPSNTSLMPMGLLKGVRSLSLADLYSYLKDWPVRTERVEPMPNQE